MTLVKYCVVRLHDGRGNLRTGPDGEAQLGLLAVVDGEALQHEAAETTAGSTADSIVDHESFRYTIMEISS